MNGNFNVTAEGITRCPICGADTHGQDRLVLEGTGWRCRTCFQVFADHRLVRRDNADRMYRQLYENLQMGKFEAVLAQLEELRAEVEKDELLRDMIPFVEYVDFRARYQVLGPIVDAHGNDTGCFTPCNIDLFAREKIEKHPFFSLSEAGMEDMLSAVRKQILRSADSYQMLLRRHKENAGSVNSFDIFLCHKTDSDGKKENTPDFRLAKQMYKALTKNGFRVFFAPETKKTMEGMKNLNEFGNKWREWIYDALLTSKVMLVIATRTDFLTSPNVQNEWVTFSRFARQKYHSHCMLYPVFHDDCRSECLDLMFGREIENYYGTFFTGKDKLNQKPFLDAMTTALQNIKESERYRLFEYQQSGLFNYDEEKYLQEAMDDEGLGHTAKALQKYEYLWERFRLPEAAERLGLLYLDAEKSFRHFREAGTPTAEAHIAFCLLQGRGCKKDPLAAHHLLKGNNEPLARYYMALGFVNAAMEEETEENKSSPWRNEAAAKEALRNLKNMVEDNTAARTLYGLCLYAGIIVEENKERARTLLEGTRECDELFG